MTEARRNFLHSQCVLGFSVDSGEIKSCSLFLHNISRTFMSLFSHSNQPNLGVILSHLNCSNYSRYDSQFINMCVWEVSHLYT